MTTKEMRMRQALMALYLQVPAEVAKDVTRAAMDAIDELQSLNEDKFNTIEAYCKAASSDKWKIKKLLSACRSALKPISEIAGINAENRAGWAHKELVEAIAIAEK